jgi:hypothetical protein
VQQDFNGALVPALSCRGASESRSTPFNDGNSRGQAAVTVGVQTSGDSIFDPMA